jgi:hypothetical protein
MSTSAVIPSDRAGEFLRAEAELVIEQVSVGTSNTWCAILVSRQARKDKAEKNKDLGDPIALNGTPIDMQVRGQFAWTAESGHVVRKTNLNVCILALQSSQADCR